MQARAREGTCLEALVRMAMPLCQAAERQCPRAGPGRPPKFSDWVMAVLIMVAVLKKRKSKSAQYRFLSEHAIELQQWLSLKGFPSRRTYFDRYRRVHRLLNVAIRLQGRQAIDEGVADATVVAVDKSLLPAPGPGWPQAARREGRHLRGVDAEAAWGYSEYHGWVYGYSYEVVVTATDGSVVYPLLASAGTADASEHRTLGEKIPELPRSTRYVLADGGYDNNAYGEAIECGEDGRRTGRRLVCPLQARGGKPCVGAMGRRGRRERSRRHRARRWAFYCSRRGKQLYRRRGQTVEPFHDWFKSLFELRERTWHRGLDNNRTQILAAIFAHQIVLRYNQQRGRPNGQVQWILDQL